MGCITAIDEYRFGSCASFNLFRLLDNGFNYSGLQYSVLAKSDIMGNYNKTACTTYRICS